MPTHLLHALDMFAQFFVSPLFAKSALKREVKAVESEFVEVNTHDSTRLQDLMIHTAKTGHPASKFGYVASFCNTIIDCQPNIPLCLLLSIQPTLGTRFLIFKSTLVSYTSAYSSCYLATLLILGGVT